MSDVTGRMFPASATRIGWLPTSQHSKMRGGVVLKKESKVDDDAPVTEAGEAWIALIGPPRNDSRWFGASSLSPTSNRFITTSRWCSVPVKIMVSFMG